MLSESKSGVFVLGGAVHSPWQEVRTMGHIGIVGDRDPYNWSTSQC